MAKIDVSQIDELTGLFSRRGFIERFSEALADAKSSPQEAPLSINSLRSMSNMGMSQAIMCW
jgi:GGDEF domain-containing protein